MNKFIFKLNAKRIVFSVVVLFLSLSCFSQTTTIDLDYLKSSLSTTACNVFSPSVAVNAITHSSLAGGVSFNTTNGLYLDAQTSTNPFSGTGFVIDYNFVPGYNYDISITANGDASMYLNTSVVSNLNAFPITSTGSCTLDPKVSTWNTVGDGQLSVQCTGASHTFNVPTFSISSGMPIYLVIWATGGNPSLIFDNLTISKIVITKTAIASSFNITPATISLTCGTTSPVTYTVNNPGGVTGITDYTWNLGATPNGWKLPNGSAAPSTYSTGTINTLTLTPSCGSTLANISATVTANGTQYNTNQSGTSITQPSLSISGNSTLCSGSSTYSVANLPCNASVNWSASPDGIVSLSCTSCNSTTITKTGDGSVTLTATVSNVCGSTPFVLNKSIAVGYSLTGTITQSGNNTPMYTTNSIAAGATSVTFQWPGVSGISCYQSSTNPSVSQTGFIYYPSQSKFWFTLSSGQSITVSFSGTGCGGTTVATRSFTVGGHYYVVSPNPASSSINITPASDDGNLTTESSQTGTTTQVSITDVSGNLKKQQQFSTGTAKMQLNVADLIPGTYFVHIINGTINETHQLIIHR